MSKKLIFTQETNNPQEYYWFKSGLSHEEVDKVIKLASEIKEERASTIGHDDGANTRSSMVKWIPQTKEWEWLYQKMMDQAKEANTELWDFDLYSSIENIQYTEYYASENGHYDWHQDIGPGELPSKRKISITIQLSTSEEYEGGELLICKGSNGEGQLDANATCPRGKGVSVLFPSYMMHRVSPVTKGVRKSLVLWVGGAHYR